MGQHFTLTRTGNSVVLTVPMPRPYLPIPAWLAPVDLWSMILWPFAVVVWLVCYLIIRWIFRIAPPPRAVFEIDARTFKATFYSPSTGERSTIEYPREAIIDLRKNQYGKGLWVHAQGINMETYLTDFPNETIESLAEGLLSEIGDRSRSSSQNTGSMAVESTLDKKA